MRRILIAHPERTFASEIQELLQNFGEDEPPFCAAVFNVESVRRRMVEAPTPFDALIIAVSLPGNGRSATAPGPGNQNGLGFAEAVREAGNKVPIILVVDSTNDELYRRAQKLENVETVLTGTDWDRAFRTQYSKLLPINTHTHMPLQFAEKASRGTLDVDIVLDLRADLPHCTCHMSQPADVFDEYYPLDLRRDELEKLKKNVPGPDEAEWESKFQDIGRSLYQRLFSTKPDLLKDFAEHGGIRAARIRFIVKTPGDRDSAVHLIPFEAIYDHDNRDYWMLTAPIYRRLNKSIPRWPLFKDAKSRHGEYVNCLIIESQVNAYIDEPVAKAFKPLPQAAVEAADLAAYLRTQQSLSKLGRVARFPQDFDVPQGQFRQALEAALTDPKARWNLVHYSGHSHLSVQARLDQVTGDPKRIADGYLILPEQTAYSMARFVDALKKAQTQFLFLSSCQAASYEFLWEASRAVPAVMGFRWKVPDRDAKDFALTFYRKLFEGTRFLEYAFTAARHEMYRRVTDSDDEKPESASIWASPVLLMQIGEAQSVHA